MALAKSVAGLLVLLGASWVVEAGASMEVAENMRCYWIVHAGVRGWTFAGWVGRTGLLD